VYASIVNIYFLSFFLKLTPIAKTIIFGLDRQDEKSQTKATFPNLLKRQMRFLLVCKSSCLHHLLKIPQRVTRATYKIERDTCLGRKSRNISPAPNPRDAAAGESIYQQRERALGAARCQKAPKHNKLSLFARDLLEQKAAWSGAGALVSLLLGAKPRK
jgi:hypothetical protein